MIIVILIVFIAIIASGAVILEKGDFSYDELGIGAMAFGFIGFLVALIVCLVLGINVSKLSTINAKIEMYQEENAKIEQQIADAVSEYQLFEKDVFSSVKPESSIALVAVYPELKADSLVQKQIEIYISNNEKIKELKEEQISGDVLRWWLYFGGKKGA